MRVAVIFAVLGILSSFVKPAVAEVSISLCEKDGVAGIGHGPTVREAETKALQNCWIQRNNPSYTSCCAIRTTAQSKCIAVAFDQSTNAWGMGSGKSPASADLDALEDCAADGGKSCVIVRHGCPINSGR